MSALSRDARDTIKYWNPGVITIAGYIREHGDINGRWAGDSCGCSDDRCMDGYHHEPTDECGCLPVLLAEMDSRLTTVQAWSQGQERT